MMDPIVLISNLRKLYTMEGDVVVKALDDVSLEIKKGSFVITMGPSGSGKSTLMQILGGLDRPTSGVVNVDGFSIHELDEREIAIYRRKKIGFVFQSFNLLPTMSALENVALPLRLNGISKKERMQRASQLLAQVGLSDRLHHRPTELSGGQQQRIAIARALANDPPIILADEPTGNLDSNSGELVMDLLKDLNRNEKTIFVVTHDPRMERYADQVVRMFDGKIVTNLSHNSDSLVKEPVVL
jgi:putative ABC transport system ATP-binding protein